MKVTKVISMPGVCPVATRRRRMSDELQKEIDYWRSNKIIQKMLKEGLISEVEFNKIDVLNRQSFSPVLAQLMA